MKLLVRLILAITCALPALAASPIPAQSDPAQNTQPIAWNELGAKATAQYSDDGLAGERDRQWSAAAMRISEAGRRGNAEGIVVGICRLPSLAPCFYE
jgi:hypothetical protein